MLFAIICLDKPGHVAVRLENRAAHLAHIQGANGAIQQAGPFLDAAGEMVGSLLIYDGADIAEAQAWAAADPYALAGLFAEVTIRPWKRVIG